MLDISVSKRKTEFQSAHRHICTAAPSSVFEENYNAGAVQTCRNRMAVGVWTFLLLYLIIAGRIFFVCLPHGIVLNTEEKELTQAQDIALLNLKRSDILDRNGILIATSLPTVNLYANPKKVQNPKDVAEKLSFLFPEMSYADLYAKLTKPRTVFSMIKYNLSPSQQAEVNALGIPALEFQESQKRVYPHQNLFSHVLGYTNIDNLGLAGIEKFMHTRLTQSSKPLELTLDLGIQDAIRQELTEAITRYQAAAASAVLMNVQTGEVISLVSLPDFDPNQNINVGDKSLFTFPTLGTYEPGSVFKTFNTALALESGKVKTTDKFDATKPIVIQKRKISDFHGENRWLSVGEILVHSSNVGSVQMVLKVGKEDQRKFLENLNFFKPLSEFELSEKARPMFQSAKNWTDVVSATVSYGHGIAVTPLHVISAFCALVNGGIYHYPTILKSSSSGARRVISEETSEQMRPLLRDVVLYGSGKKADVKGYAVMGKTGTAQKSVNGRYIEKLVTNSFLSAFPASNPKYALLVVIDEPKATKETYGFNTSGWNATPTAGRIISAVAPQLGVAADFDIDTQKEHVKAAFKH